MSYDEILIISVHGRILSKQTSTPIYKLPSIQALFIQLFSFGLLWLTWKILSPYLSFDVTVGTAVLLQAFLSAVISFLARLPKWWWYIQFAFPFALFATFTFNFHPSIFLFCFLILLLVFWNLFKTRVPLFLSGKVAWHLIAEQLPTDKPIQFIDIGSGVGGLLLHLERQFSKISFTGIELAPLPWAISRIRSVLNRSHIQLLYGDYTNLNFADYDVVFAYLSPAAMDALWAKASTEMRSGTLLLSLEFSIQSVEPDFLIQDNEETSVIYAWRIK